MAIVASTVAGLGAPSNDGEAGVIAVASGERVKLRWNAAQAAWIGDACDSVMQIDNVAMKVNGDPASWRYPASPAALVGVDTAYGFQLQIVPHADELWAAGLRLQEHLSATVQNGSASSALQLAVVWYSLAAGDGFLTPTPVNFGLPLVSALSTVKAQMVTTGWQNSPVSAPTAANWYPEVYALGGGASNSFARLHARYRWVGGTLAGGTAGETQDLPPYFDDTFCAVRARNAPFAHNESVTQWPDISGRGSHLAAFGSAPTMQRGVTGDPAAYVSFDGVANALKAVNFGTGPVSNGTLFIRLRQRAGGPTQQMWVDGKSLLYRGSGTDQVNLWAGAGADLTYARGSNWPMAFTTVSVTQDGVNQTVREGTTVKVTGTSGARQFGDFVVGTNAASTLPAAIDVEAILAYSRVLNSTELANVVAWMAT